MRRNSAYGIAVQRIEKERRSGTGELDLCGEWDPKNTIALVSLTAPTGYFDQARDFDLSIEWENKNSDLLTELPESLADLTQLRSLNLSVNKLAVLPEWLGGLTQLRTLDLSMNKLTELPEWLGKLTLLEKLYISGNGLTKLPESLSRLTQLRTLDLSVNNLTELPEWLGKLALLRRLNVSSNRLTELPKSLSELTQLQLLYLSSNRLTELPDSLGMLEQLQLLDVSRNSLTALPESLSELAQLQVLDITKNPVDSNLAAACSEGIDAVKCYLRELGKGAKRRYEAKLLILGDGDEGKTCVSRALRGLLFCDQPTTHGVDVEPWKFAHPDYPEDHEKDITLNIWDFEGQEISHQTHQFFLSPQSLYLLVFKCRDQFRMDRAEYWLDTIRARAPKAKVAIVITQCEERSPFVPRDQIQAQYGDLLAKEWFFPVGCEDGANVPVLREALKRWVADLEFMGLRWPASYAKAEAGLKLAELESAHITREELAAVFAAAGVASDGCELAAAEMSRLGIITQFPDCPDLRDFIVLRPQWLTKAISRVMEDRRLYEAMGEIALTRMEAMWREDYPGMFPTFHNCMKEFELCYDLDRSGHDCLIPLRFGYLKPEIPWSGARDMKERRVEYKLTIHPPIGIMSRLIVKMHHLIVKTSEHPKGVFWQNGVFLRSGEGPLCSEALCEYMPEHRTLRVEVRAAYPQSLCEQIHAYVQAVFSIFEGLDAERSFGCIKIDATTGAESKCSGMHRERRIYTAIANERPTIDCEFEYHEVDPRVLVGGFGSFNEFVPSKTYLQAVLRRELDRQPAWAAWLVRKVDSLLDWMTENGQKMDRLLDGQENLPAAFKQEAEMKLHEYLTLTSQMLDDREVTAAPGILSINTKDRSKWNPMCLFTTTFVLTPYCECKGDIHSCEDGRVEFVIDRAWWATSSQLLARGTKVLAVGLQLAFAGMPLWLGKNVFDVIRDDVHFMTELSRHITLAPGNLKASTTGELAIEAGAGKAISVDDPDATLQRNAILELLKGVAPINYEARQWGSLRRIRMSDNSYRWLCSKHATQAR